MRGGARLASGESESEARRKMKRGVREEAIRALLACV